MIKSNFEAQISFGNCMGSTTFQYLKNFFDETSGDINKCDFLILWSKRGQHLAGLHNSQLTFCEWTIHDD